MGTRCHTVGNYTHWIFPVMSSQQGAVLVPAVPAVVTAVVTKICRFNDSCWRLCEEALETSYDEQGLL